jgi:hypothetical protein
MVTPRRLPTFWYTEGRIMWRGAVRPIPITALQAQRLRETYRDDCRVAYDSGHMATAAWAARLWMELGAALDEFEPERRPRGASAP